MKTEELIAIDVHTHAEVSCRNPTDEVWKEFEDTASKYFKAEKRPTIPETVAYYRERKIGLVMFTVDSSALEQLTGSLMAQVVKAQILDAEHVAGAREGSADAPGIVRKDVRARARLVLDDRPRFRGIFEPPVVALLDIGCFASRTRPVRAGSSLSRHSRRQISASRRAEAIAKSMIAWYIDTFETISKWQRSKQTHLEFLERHPIGKANALTLTSAKLIDHVRSRRADGAGPATVINDLVWIGVVLRAAKNVKELPVRPEITQEASGACRELRLISKPRRRARRPTADELARLREYFASRDRRAQIPMQRINSASVGAPCCTRTRAAGFSSSTSRCLAQVTAADRCANVLAS